MAAAEFSEPTVDRLTLVVNGEEVSVSDVPHRLLLSDFLRHHMDLKGTHVGCEHGVCGACTVLVDGSPARSCLMFAVQMEGADVKTVEGIEGDGGELHPIQQAFREEHALPCGFCTPGFVMSIYGYFQQHGMPKDDDEICELLSGNLCRCTGYRPIVSAVRRAGATVRSGDGVGG
jgi:aerobic-type carbon monoxide dehydrogenase small subunit (CoxS/CutS family)